MNVKDFSITNGLTNSSLVYKMEKASFLERWEGRILLDEVQKEEKIIVHLTVHIFTHRAAARAERLDTTPRRRR